MLTIWDIFRYLYKWRVFIVVVTLGATLLSYARVQKIQCYSSEIVIEYVGDNAKQGMTPNGTALDVYEIVNSNVITKALKDIDSNATVDTIRNSITISPIVPTTVEEIQKSKIKAGETYEYMPTKYSVKFVDYYGNNGNYVRDVLDSIIKNYTEYYSDKYINLYSINDIDKDVKAENHDYIESATIIRDYTDTVIQNLNHINDFGSSYRSTVTGMSFEDLITKYQEIQRYKIPTLFSEIENGQVSKNEDVLIKKYTLRHDNLMLSGKNEGERSELALGLMESFAKANVNVPNGYNYAYSGQNDDNVDTTEVVLDYRYIRGVTTYDELVDNYVDSGVHAIESEIDADYCKEIVNIFSAKNPAGDGTAAVDSINGKIEEICAELNELYEKSSKTINGYNAYVASQHIEYLSGVSLGKVVNVQVQLIITFVMALALSVLLALTVEIMKFAKKWAAEHREGSKDEGNNGGGDNAEAGEKSDETDAAAESTSS